MEEVKLSDAVAKTNKALYLLKVTSAKYPQTSQRDAINKGGILFILDWVFNSSLHYKGESIK